MRKGVEFLFSLPFRASSSMHRARFVFFIALAALIPGSNVLPSSPVNSSEPAPRPATVDPVARLQSRINRGEIKLPSDQRFGYLPAVLEALQIPHSSQLLIFSKTSLQTTLIGPKTPRAVYFTDDVAVGFVLGSDYLEIAATDPKEGVYFYTLSQSDAQPRFEGKIGCLNCHKVPATFNIQGLIVQSVVADQSGELRTAPINTDHQTPLKGRWGGWYVTGSTGAQPHMGNALARQAGSGQELETPGRRNLADLRGWVDTARTLTPYSDVVALMVLEHQARMVNHILYATDVVETSPGQVNAAVEQLLKYLLFTREAKLAEPVAGTSGFAAEFNRRGPRDRKGRSLRDLDLRTRLFRYRCSYMIYSDAFDAMPTIVRGRVYRRLWEVLTGKDSSPPFRELPAAERQAILEILRDTKRGLPAYWFQQTE